MTDPRHQRGRRAEQAVAGWLTATGWTVLDRRWRCPSGELDLVCRDPAGTLVGVEVKLRTSDRFGAPAETVDARRLARLRRSLADYAGSRVLGPPRPELRLDLVTVTPDGSGRWRLRRLAGVDAW